MPTYLSTDPYAGLGADDLVIDPGTNGDGTSPWTGGVTGTGIDPRANANAGAGGAGSPPAFGGGMSRDAVMNYIRAQYQQRGVPLSNQDLNYWTDKYFSPEFNGDYNYWNDRFTNTNESFGYKGSGQTGAGGFGSWINKVPSLEDAKNMPGLQFAIDRAGDQINKSAAGKGVLNTGGTLKDIVDYTVPVALQGYSSLANLGYSANNSNFNNFYNLANLGFNASSYGPRTPAGG